MRILYVQDTDWIRRNPIQHTHLAERLATRGHTVRAIDYEILWRTEGRDKLVSTRQEHTVSRVVEGGDVTVIRPPILKIPVLDYLSMCFTYRSEIDRQIREFRPDVVIGNDILTTYLAYRAAAKRGIPTVFYAIDIEHRLVPFRFLQSLGKAIEARNIRNADLVIAINEGLREYTVSMGADPDKTLVLRAGIDSERYDPQAVNGRMRSEYGIKPGESVLFFMGWIYTFSGLKEVALQLARTRDHGMKLLVVGDGDAYDELRGMAEADGLRDRLILTGRRPYKEIPALIAAADICLLPAYTDEQIMQDIVPIKMYEYMAMSKPVIATRLPGVVKEFGDNNGVVYVDSPDDVITKAVELAGSGEVDELGRRARRFAEQCTWDSITDRFELVLERLAREKGRAHRHRARTSKIGDTERERLPA